MRRGREEGGACIEQEAASRRGGGRLAQFPIEFTGYLPYMPIKLVSLKSAVIIGFTSTKFTSAVSANIIVRESRGHPVPARLPAWVRRSKRLSPYAEGADNSERGALLFIPQTKNGRTAQPLVGDEIPLVEGTATGVRSYGDPIGRPRLLCAPRFPLRHKNHWHGDRRRSGSCNEADNNAIRRRPVRGAGRPRT